MNLLQNNFVRIDDDLKNKLEVNSFNRPIKNSRIKSLVKNLSKSGIVCPPILVGLIGNKYIIIDGQHRLNASKTGKFDIYAQIVKMTKEQAIKNFCIHNSKAVRVSLRHRLKVDVSKNAKLLRKLSNIFRIDLQRSYAILSGILPNTNVLENAKEIDFDFANKLLTLWSKDKRWEKKGYIYSKPGVLKLIGYLCKKSSKPLLFLKKMKSIDYKNGSSLADRYGSSGSSQKQMRIYVANYLIKNGDI